MSLLAECFTKLMKENILPNACCVKGMTRIQFYYITTEERMLLLLTVQQTKATVKVGIVGCTTYTHLVSIAKIIR